MRCVWCRGRKNNSFKVVNRLRNKIQETINRLRAPSSKANGTINDDIKDVRDALSGLGYGSEEIYAVTKDLPSETETSELIKLALQKLAENSR